MSAPIVKLNLRLSAEIRDEIASSAARNNRSINSEIVTAIERYLEAVGKGRKWKAS